MNVLKHPLSINTALILTIVTSFNLHATVAIQNEKQFFSFFVLNNEGNPSSGLRKLLDAFKLKQDNAQSIVNETQKQWLRTAGKERWEVEDPHAARRGELMPFFEEVGIVHEIKPELKEFDYVLIMGALHPRVQMRMEYTIKLWNEGYRFNEIVFLGAERILNPEQEPLCTLSYDVIPKTEYDMMKWVYDAANLPEAMTGVKTSFINTPNTIGENGKIKRANTGDTIAQWLKHNPKPGTCLIISNQPHIGYQTEVAKSFLPESFEVFAAGNEINLNTKVCECLDAIARWIYQSNETLKKKKHTNAFMP